MFLFMMQLLIMFHQNLMLMQILMINEQQYQIFFYLFIAI